MTDSIENQTEQEENDGICPALTRVQRSHTPHTVRCQLLEGHEGAHSHKHDARETVWFGTPVTKIDYSTRFRFGINLERSK